MAAFFPSMANSTKAISKLLLSALLISGANAAVADDDALTLRPYEAEYRLSQNSLSTKAQRSLSKQGDTWLLSQKASLWFISVEEESVMSIAEGKILPLRYRYENSIRSKSNQHIVFDWASGEASDKVYRKPWTLPLEDDYTDQLTSQLQLRQRLLNGGDDASWTQTIVKNGKIKKYQIEKQGEERLHTNVGPMDTIKLRRKREGSSAETLIWLAPAWDYLIVRLQQIEDDEDSLNLEMLSATIDGKKVRGKAEPSAG